MYTKNQLLQEIEKLGINPSGTLLVHSSMKAIGEVDGGADVILDAFSEYMRDGLLIFPTHTWRTVGKSTTVFDSRTEPSCVGILSNTFMKRENVVRSLHPTHSVAALGKDAELYISGEETTTSPCPRDGCWGKLYDRDASILFLGCTLKSNTYIHGVEEWNNVEDRIGDFTKEYTMIDRDGKVIPVTTHPHHCSASDEISEHYDKLEPLFVYFGAIKYGTIGDAKCILGNARKMADITSAILKKMPQIFVDDRPIPEELYK